GDSMCPGPDQSGHHLIHLGRRFDPLFDRGLDLCIARHFAKFTVAVRRSRAIPPPHTSCAECPPQNLLRDEPLDYLTAAHGDKRNRWFVSGDSRRILVVELVVTAPAA